MFPPFYLETCSSVHMGKVIMHKDFPYAWCINKSPPFILQSGFDIIKYFRVQMVEICLCTMHKENPYA
ncbi:hypothetical protein QL285_046203 [Trifolium repens]|nr:hypothetical protein QL285_046203 [Trifolium repens]